MLYFGNRSFVKSSLVAVIAMGLFCCNNKETTELTTCKGTIGNIEKLYLEAASYKFDQTLKNRLLNVNLNTLINIVDEKRECEEAEIREEERLGQMEMLAQLIEAEAGNQDIKGKRLVADVVINRAYERNLDPTCAVETIIFEPGQFSCVEYGSFEKAGWYISEESFKAAEMEYENYYHRENLLDREVTFFTAGEYNYYCIPMYKYGDHYFGK